MSHLDGFGERQGFGRRPALLVIDMSVGFTSPESPLHCELEDAVAAIGQLLDAARAKGLPVVYTTVSYGEGEKAVAKAFIDKVPALLALAEGSPFTEIDPRIAPLPAEPVINKLFASAFFGTSLQSLLAAHDCDSVLLTGTSTSGCVRATAVDVLQNGTGSQFRARRLATAIPPPTSRPSTTSTRSTATSSRSRSRSRGSRRFL